METIDAIRERLTDAPNLIPVYFIHGPKKHILFGDSMFEWIGNNIRVTIEFKLFFHFDSNEENLFSVYMVYNSTADKISIGKGSFEQKDGKAILVVEFESASKAGQLIYDVRSFVI